MIEEEMIDVRLMEKKGKRNMKHVRWMIERMDIEK